MEPGMVFEGLVSIAGFLLIQTGALIYWAGRVTQTQQDQGVRLDKTETRLDKTEARAIETANRLAYIRGQGGMNDET